MKSCLILKKLASRGGYAGAFAFEDDGFLFLAYLQMPMRGESSMSGLGRVATVAVLAGMVTPVMLKARKASDDSRMLANLKTYVTAQIAYYADFGKYSASGAELADKDYLPEEFVLMLEESGFESFVDADFDPKQRAILGGTDSARDAGSVLVVWNDGSVTSITLEGLEA